MWIEALLLLVVRKSCLLSYILNFSTFMNINPIKYKEPLKSITLRLFCTYQTTRINIGIYLSTYANASGKKNIKCNKFGLVYFYVLIIILSSVSFIIPKFSCSKIWFTAYCCPMTTFSKSLKYLNKFLGSFCLFTYNSTMASQD